MLNNTPVLAAGQVRTVTLDGVVYILRALTHGEHVALQAAGRAVRAPSNDLIEEMVREAAIAAGREDLAQAILDCQDAQDRLAAHFAAMPPSLDAEGQARWRAEHLAEQQAIERPLFSAQRKRRLAMELYAREGAVARLLAEAEDAQVANVRHLIALALVRIGNQTGPFTAEQVAELPSAHVQQLAMAASELLHVSADAAKN